MPEVITAGETMAVMVPAEPGPLRYVHDYRLKMAGAESNAAVGLCKLGHSVGWISRLGEDEMGHYLLGAIRAEGVDTRNVRMDEQHRTGLMLKETGSGETKVYYYRQDSAASHMCAEDLDEGYLGAARILYLTGITPVLSEECRAAAKKIADISAERGIPMGFDPNIRKKLWNGRDFRPLLRELLFAARIPMLGLDEAKELLDTRDTEVIVSLLRGQGAEWIALKDGSRGAWVADRERIVKIEPFPCRSVDPVGAGDAFNAGFLAGILEGRDLQTCGRMGAAAGAMATETLGDIEGYPSRSQLQICLDGGQQIYR